MYIHDMHESIYLAGRSIVGMVIGEESALFLWIDDDRSMTLEMLAAAGS
jgi:hypothetical protein